MNPSREAKRRSRTADAILFVCVLGLVCAVWFGAWMLIDLNIRGVPPENDSALRAQFGDKFGAVNALFSGLAFAGIILTILLQRRDLAETHTAMRHEQFNNTFFQLVSLHIENTNNVRALGLEGKEAFEAFNNFTKASDKDFHVFCALQKLDRDQIRQIIDTKDISLQLYPKLEEADVANIQESLSHGVRSLQNFLDQDLGMHEQKIRDAYIKSCVKCIDHFSHYYRTLYHILKFLDESDLVEAADKPNYARFLRSQLSDTELVSIFYNSITKTDLPGRESMELGFPKMGKLLRRFDVLQNMSPRSVFHPLHLTIFDKNNPRESQDGA